VRFGWFALLFSAICLEGLGRKYLPAIPGTFFYFLKDGVLIVGLIRLRPAMQISRTMRWLYRGFAAFALLAVGWTAVQMFNPGSPSLLLGMLGFRAYWLWWLAPVFVVSCLRTPALKRRAIYFVLFISAGISILGAFQFGAPSTSAINLYSVVDGAEVYAATVSSTTRARVSGTFSFASGFAAFTVLVPTLLLSLGLEARDPKMRRLMLGGTLLAASVTLMSGSRAALLSGLLVLCITAWSAGLFFTRLGRRIVVGGIVAAVLSVVAFPEAYEGVKGRFENSDETNTRLLNLATVLPPVALVTFDYPIMGLGTGIQQNARLSMGVGPQKYEEELATGRTLIELGAPGYLLVWISQVGLIVALLRASAILKRGGRRGACGAARSYAAIIPFSSFVFDHIFQALFFVGCGFILQELLEVMAAEQAQRTAVAANPAPNPLPVAVRR
jgi:hypothetical protein